MNEWKMNQTKRKPNTKDQEHTHLRDTLCDCMFNAYMAWFMSAVRTVFMQIGLDQMNIKIQERTHTQIRERKIEWQTLWQCIQMMCICACACVSME